MCSWQQYQLIDNTDNLFFKNPPKSSRNNHFSLGNEVKEGGGKLGHGGGKLGHGRLEYFYTFLKPLGGGGGGGGGGGYRQRPANRQF